MYVSSSTLDRAWRAQRAMRDMLPILTAFATALCKRPIKVIIDGGTPRTDGKVIYMRPPIELGDVLEHYRPNCLARDPETSKMLCPACEQVDQVWAVMFHEMAHIIFDTFAPMTDAEKAKYIDRAIAEMGANAAEGTRLAKLKKYENKITRRGYMTGAALISPYLPKIVNALEDARVNRGMYQARAGTFHMFRAHVMDVFDNGLEMDDGTTKMWSEAGRNRQAIVGLYCKASGFDYQRWFLPEVVEALDDEDLTVLLSGIADAPGPQTTYALAFPALEILRRYGFCKRRDDIKDDPPPTPEPEEEEPQDTPAEQGEDENVPDQPQPPEPGDTDPDNEETTDDEPSEEVDAPDASPSEDDGDAEDAAPSDASDDDDPAEDGDESDPGDDEAPADSADDDDDSEQGGDPVDDGDEGDGDTDPDEDGLEPGDESDDDDLPPWSEDEDVAEPDEDGADPDAGLDDQDAPALEPDDADDPDEDDDADLTDDEDYSDDESFDPAQDDDESDEDGPGQGWDDEDEEADWDDFENPNAGEPSDDGSESGGGDGVPEDDDEDDGEPVDLDLGDDEGASPEANQGGSFGGDDDEDDEEPEDEDDLDEIDNDLNKFGDHEEKDRDNRDEEALSQAIRQANFFDAPSQHVHQVNVFTLKDEADPRWQQYLNFLRWGDAETVAQVMPPEAILSQTLLKTRVVFAENAKARREPGHRSGRVNSQRLASVRTGNKDVFTRANNPGKRDYFVSVTMDVSGSTAWDNRLGADKYRSKEPNIKIIRELGMGVGELLNRVGVPFAMHAHTAASHRDYSRGMDLDILRIKGEHEQWSDQCRTTVALLQPTQGNLDGHTLEWQRKLVERHDATDRFILYVTDGEMPASNYSEELEILRREIETCRRMGIHLLGVGVRTDSPKEHGLDTIQLDTCDDLPLLIKELERRLGRR